MLPKRKKSIKKEEAVPRHAEDDDDASSSSLSEASLQLDQAAEKRLPLNSGSGGNSSSGEESFDLEIGVNNASGSVDLDVLTDDEEEDDDAGDDDETDEGGDQLVDLLKDGAKRRSLQKKLSESLLNPEEEEEMATFELDRLLYLRRTVIWFYSMGMGATGALAYLYASGTLSIGDESMEEWLVPVVLVAIWLLVAIVVFLYDRAAHRALNKLQLTATKHTKIVNSLFPENFRSRMLKEQSRRIKQKERRDRSRRGSGGDSVKSGKSAGNNSFSGKLSLGSLGNKKRRRRNRKEQRKRRGGRRPDTLAAEAASSPANATLATAAGTEITEDSDVADDNISMSDGEEGLIPKDILTNKPIADFFPHCTVLFADIAGFTAWSSVRDPTAVFTLLESLYSCFDGIARRLKVFKVETIGDCYVAVTGLPEPQADHAIRMAQFSRACMGKMMQIVRALEKHLGPDTGDLSMRFGLHRYARFNCLSWFCRNE
jgi:class 3 adenylate cyclase